MGKAYKADETASLPARWHVPSREVELSWKMEVEKKLSRDVR